MVVLLLCSCHAQLLPRFCWLGCSAILLGCYVIAGVAVLVVAAVVSVCTAAAVAVKGVVVQSWCL